MKPARPATIDEYIADCPRDVQQLLEQIRATVKKAAPAARECISYNMPGFKLGKLYIAHFAAFKNHIGFYPVPTGHAAFEEELSHYKTGKGSVQFPLDKPLPLGLITRMVEYRIKNSLQ